MSEAIMNFRKIPGCLLNDFFASGKRYLSNNIDLAIITNSDIMEL